jgi:hypothetical protein
VIKLGGLLAIHLDAARFEPLFNGVATPILQLFTEKDQQAASLFSL